MSEPKADKKLPTGFAQRGAVTRPRVFFYHLNRPASHAAGTTMWSVHHAGVCHVVARVVCRVPTETKANRAQPRGVVRGKCRRVTVGGGIATIE